METTNVVLGVSNDGDLKKMDTLSMASSSGEQRSFWASNVEHALRIMREELDTEPSEFRILKVPEGNRQPAAAYTPELWRFGLHNRDGNRVAMSETEAAKRAVVVLFGLDQISEWTSFCDDVVPDPKAMLKCYGLHKEVNDLLEAEIKQVLAFDALFLALRMIDLIPNDSWLSRRLMSPDLRASLRGVSQASVQGVNFLHTFRDCYQLVYIDLCKIENQIPLDLIKRAIDHVEKLTNPGQENTEGLESWMKAAVKMAMDQFMTISDDFYEGANATQELSKSYHILAAAYKVICGVDGIRRVRDPSNKDYIHVLSATRLKESGIEIQGVSGPLSCMAYDKKKKCLRLPKMKIYDRTVPVVRNMARYEQYLEDGSHSMFHDYVLFMWDLIQTPLDLDYLVQCDVVYSGFGNKGVDVWRAIEENFVLRSSEEHNEMKRDINKRCKLRRHRLWSEFRTLFLSRPWLTLSAVAITLVTFATLVQTYAAVINTKGMKPQYNP